MDISVVGRNGASVEIFPIFYYPSFVCSSVCLYEKGVESRVLKSPIKRYFQRLKDERHPFDCFRRAGLSSQVKAGEEDPYPRKQQRLGTLHKVMFRCVEFPIDRFARRRKNVTADDYVKSFSWGHDHCLHHYF